MTWENLEWTRGNAVKANSSPLLVVPVILKGLSSHWVSELNWSFFQGHLLSFWVLLISGDLWNVKILLSACLSVRMPRAYQIDLNFSLGFPLIYYIKLNLSLFSELSLIPCSVKKACSSPAAALSWYYVPKLLFAHCQSYVCLSPTRDV